jgi:hypothetical protein
MRHLVRILVILALLLGSSIDVAPGAAGAAAQSPSVTMAADGHNVELAGHLGGRVGAIAVQGGYAYLGAGPELAVLDLANPANPKRAGYVVLPDQVLAIALAGQYAYVGVGDVNSGEGGVAVVSIATPLAPALLNFYPSSSVNDLALAGSYLYLATQAGDMLVLNITNPVVPIQVGAFDSPGYPNNGLPEVEVAVAGARAYFADGGGGMRVLDISNPAAPVQVGFYASEQLWDIAVAGRYAYVIDGGAEGRSGLAIVDVSNPAAPVEVGFYSRNDVFAVAVAGSYAYIADGFNGLRVVNIAKPAKPTEVGYYNPGGRATAIAVASTYAYVGYSYGAGGVRIVNTVKPNAPVQVGFYQAPQTIQDIVVAGNYAYVTEDTLALHIVDLANRANPVVLGTLAGYTWGGISVAVQGHYAYVLSGDGLRVVDITNPAAPVRVGLYEISDIGLPHAVAVAGNYLYIVLDAGYHGIGGGGLLVLDVSNPAAPVRVSLTEALRSTASVAIDGKYAYVGSGNYGRYGLTVLDVSNPAAPAEISFYNAHGAVGDIIVDGRYAYLAVPPWYDMLGYVLGGLRVLDVSNPIAPTLVGSLDMPEGAYRVAIEGSYAYVTTSDGKLRVVDISDPAAPVQVGFYPSGGAVVAAGGYIYLGANGLSTLQFTGVSLSGRVADVHGAPIGPVLLTTNTGRTAVTDSSGVYTFTNMPSGSYVLTPTLAGYSFEPPTHTVRLGPDTTGVDFTIFTSPVSVTLAPSAPTTLVYTDTQGLRTEVQIPAGAVTQTTTLRLTPTLVGPLSGYAFAGHAFTLAAERSGAALPEFSFSQPLTVTIGYSTADVRVVSDTSKLALWRWNVGSWQDAAQSCAPPAVYTRDPANRRLAVALCRSGRFALFGPTRQVFLPRVGR